jgi:electron transport complex protein RnfG
MSGTEQAGATGSPTAPDVPSGRLIATLGAAGAMAGLLIVLAFQGTLPAIERNRAARTDRAIHEVLVGLDHYDTLYLYEGALTAQVPQGVDDRPLERAYAGYNAAGARVGFAIATGEPGFQDVIRILFGFDPATRTTLGLTILSSLETPGLGDKINEEGWRRQFRGRKTPLVRVKQGQSKAPDEVDAITGATISSRTVIGAVNKGVERWAPLIDAYLAKGGS